MTGCDAARRGASPGCPDRRERRRNRRNARKRGPNRRNARKRGRIAERTSAPADLAAFVRFGQIFAVTQESAANRRRCHAFWSQRGSLSCVLSRAGLAGAPPRAADPGHATADGPHPTPSSLQNERPPRYVEAGSGEAAAAAAAAAAGGRPRTPLHLGPHHRRHLGPEQLDRPHARRACATAPTLICAR